MPNRDGTGPFGEGQLTGRGLGPCGRGLRSGFGFRRAFAQPVELSKDQQIKVLEADKTELEAGLTETNKKLKELKK